MSKLLQSEFNFTAMIRIACCEHKICRFYGKFVNDRGDAIIMHAWYILQWNLTNRSEKGKLLEPVSNNTVTLWTVYCGGDWRRFCGKVHSDHDDEVILHMTHIRQCIMTGWTEKIKWFKLEGNRFEITWIMRYEARITRFDRKVSVILSNSCARMQLLPQSDWWIYQRFTSTDGADALTDVVESSFN